MKKAIFLTLIIILSFNTVGYGKEINVIKNEFENSLIDIDEIDRVIVKEVDGVVIAKIPFFNNETSKQMNQMYKLMGKHGYTNLILDLRDNSGGLIKESVDVANLFILDGKICTIKYLDGSEEVITTKKYKKSITDFNVVILVNGITASASELLTLTLVENNNAITVGVNSYGKNSIQQLDDELNHITIGHYYVADEFKPIEVDYYVTNDFVDVNSSDFVEDDGVFYTETTIETLLVRDRQLEMALEILYLTK